LPSNLRPTTRECVHLVTCGHFRSCDRWRLYHSICHSQKPHDTRKPHGMALSFIEPVLWSIEVLHCGNRDFRLFCSCDLDLDPMTFIGYTNFTRIRWRYTGAANLNLQRHGFRKLSSDRHTYIQTDTTEIIYHVASKIMYSCA